MIVFGVNTAICIAVVTQDVLSLYCRRGKTWEGQNL